MLTVWRYVPSGMLPEHMEELTISELYELIAKANVLRQMEWEDIRIGICKAFPKKE